ncbi:hypothetical protein ACIA2T_40095 [Amycolatopsis japonica]|uniref:hypothetical protein n=1 Tax=Amycolatopsis japonica TaxID=208439 RepID=UPI0037B2C8EE
MSSSQQSSITSPPPEDPEVSPAFPYTADDRAGMAKRSDAVLAGRLTTGQAGIFTEPAQETGQ